MDNVMIRFLIGLLFLALVFFIARVLELGHQVTGLVMVAAVIVFLIFVFRPYLTGRNL